MKNRVRPLTSGEHTHVIDYFHSASDDLLKTMGIVRDRLLPKDEWREALLTEFQRPLSRRSKSYVGWEYNGELIGHSSISDIRFGADANVHLHMWVPAKRRSGLGTWFFCHSVAYFFETFNLKMLACEPHAENPAPNRALQKLGLPIAKTYRGIPGAHCFEQMINRYEILAAQVPELLNGLDT